MEYVWPIIITAIILMILWGIISNKIKRRRIRKATEKLFPKVIDHIQVDRRYNIFLSHGKTLDNVLFLGISPEYDNGNPYLPFPLCQWLIVEKENGKRAYIKPQLVRYYEDAEG